MKCTDRPHTHPSYTNGCHDQRVRDRQGPRGQGQQGVQGASRARGKATKTGHELAADAARAQNTTTMMAKGKSQAASSSQWCVSVGALAASGWRSSLLLCLSRGSVSGGAHGARRAAAARAARSRGPQLAAARVGSLSFAALGALQLGIAPCGGPGFGACSARLGGPRAAFPRCARGASTPHVGAARSARPGRADRAQLLPISASLLFCSATPSSAAADASRAAGTARTAPSSWARTPATPRPT